MAAARRVTRKRAERGPRPWAWITRPVLIGDWHARRYNVVTDRALAKRLVKLGVARRM